MAEYIIRIVAEGEDRASGPLGRVSGAMGNILQIAAGGVLAGGILGIGSALQGTIGSALQATSAYENLGISLESLVARELKNASGVEKVIAVGKERIQLTQKEISELARLKQSLTDEGLARDTLAARIQEQKERVRQLTVQYGENGLVVIKARAELAQMENSLGKLDGTIAAHNARIDALNSKQGALVDVTKKVVEGQLSMNEALEQAGPKAKALLDWIQQLAIQSPFKQSDIADAFKTAMAYGFTTDEAKKLTGQLVDFSAVVDPTGQKMGLIAYALGQIRTSDKLLTQDLRQLMNAGVDVNAILGTMGFKLSDVGEKSISSQEFLKAFSAMMDRDFQGAAKRSAGTLTGLLSSLEDIKEVGLRNLFEGAFGALKPLLQDAVDTFSAPAFMDKLRGIGTSIGQGVSIAIGWIRQGIAWVQKFARIIEMSLGAGLSPIEALRNALRVMLPRELTPFIMTLFGLLMNLGGFFTQTLIPNIAAATPVVIGFFQNLLTAALPFLTALGPQIVAAFQGILLFFTGTLIPAFLQFAAIAGPQLGAGLNQLVIWFQQIVTWGQQLALMVLPLLVQGFQWAAANMQIVAPVLGVIAAALGLILAPLIAIPALLVVLATAWANNWGGIQEKSAAVWAILQPILAGIGGFIMGTIVPGVITLAQWLGVNVPAAIMAMQMGFNSLQPVFGLVSRYISAAVSVIQSLVSIWASLNRLASGLINYLGQVIAKFLGIDTSAAATQQRLDGVGQFLGVLGGIINSFISGVLAMLVQQFGILVGLLETLAHWLGIVADALANLQVPEAFQRHSPSPFEQMLMNSNEHLREMATLLPRSLGMMNSYGMGSLSPTGLGGALNVGARGAAPTRNTHFYGPITVHANDAKEFYASLRNLEDDVVARDRMGER